MILRDEALASQIRDVKELLEHSDIKTTMRYAHTNREAKMRAVRQPGSGSGKVVTVPDRRKKSA